MMTAKIWTVVPAAIVILSGSAMANDRTATTEQLGAEPARFEVASFQSPDATAKARFEYHLNWTAATTGTRILGAEPDHSRPVQVLSRERFEEMLRD